MKLFANRHRFLENLFVKIFGGKRPIGHFGLVSISVGFLLGAASLIATSGCGESSTSQGRDLDPGKGATAARKIEGAELSENLNFARLLGPAAFCVCCGRRSVHH